jgi:hypothetical protein
MNQWKRWRRELKERGGAEGSLPRWKKANGNGGEGK